MQPLESRVPQPFQAFRLTTLPLNKGTTSIQGCSRISVSRAIPTILPAMRRMRAHKPTLAMQLLHSRTKPNTNPVRPTRSELEQDIQRLQVNSSEEPPPAYSSVSQPNQALPPEKRPAGNERPNLSVSPATANAGVTNQAAVQGGESSAQPQTIHQPTPIPQHVYQGNQQQEQQQQPQHPQPTPSPAPSRNSPPPLPEGWLAVYHQDSGTLLLRP